MMKSHHKTFVSRLDRNLFRIIGHHHTQRQCVIYIFQHNHKN